MYKRSATLLTTVLVLGACSADLSGSQASASLPSLPDEIAALAAPNQDLKTARLRPEDNCYWYMHAGPVETTLLPLRTTRGNPICIKPAT